MTFTPRRRAVLPTTYLGNTDTSAALVEEAKVKPLDFQAFFNSWIESTKKTWGHDRSKTLGGSEVFGCIRKAWYSRNGTPKDADYTESWGATKRGDIIENHFVVPAMDHAMEKFGFTIEYHGEDQRTLFADGVPLSVTPDGLISGLPRNALSKYGIDDLLSDCCMLEIKSIDPRVDLAEEKTIHHGQTQIQMGLVRENTEMKPMFAVILYINASFLDDIEVFIVKFDERKYATAKKRALTVFETTDPDALMREGRIDGSCQYCPFQDSCIATQIAGMPKVDPATVGKKSKKGEETDPSIAAELEPLIAEKRRLLKIKQKAEKEHELAAEQLKQRLRELGKNRAKGDGWSVSYSMAKGRVTMDMPALEEKIAEVNEFFALHGRNELLALEDMQKEGTPYEVMRVTFKEPDQDDE
jgi:CRISPR/Cas system-associated exonuclease Cas4 (RecB family)